MKVIKRRLFYSQRYPSNHLLKKVFCYYPYKDIWIPVTALAL